MIEAEEHKSSAFVVFVILVSIVISVDKKRFINYDGDSVVNISLKIDRYSRQNDNN